jgi:hypothetical protein
MELVPLASAVLGVVGGVLRLWNGGLLSSGKGRKGGKAGSEDVKLTLTPPLFARHRDRNAAASSPLDALDLHREALFSSLYADGQAVLLSAQLQPQQQQYHDIEAVVRLPVGAAGGLPFFSSASRSPSARPPLSPVADVIVRVQPSPLEPSFLQLRLSTEDGGRANAVGCLRLPLQRVVSADSGGTPDLSVIFSAPVFNYTEQQLLLPGREATGSESLNSAAARVGLRVDSAGGGSSVGLSVSPFRPSFVSGWLSSSLFLSGSQNAALRGGLSFSGDASGLLALQPGEAEKADSGRLQVDGAVFYSQMVEAEEDSVQAASGEVTVVRSPVPAYEIGVRLRDGGEELVTSFFNHLTIRRRVWNPLESSSVVGIHNYVTVGMELSMRRTRQPSWRLAGSWQLNKNLLLKSRLSDSAASACVAVKSWHSPSSLLALAAHYDYQSGLQLGLSAALENVGSVLFGKAPIGYRRTISTRKADVTYQVQTEQNY